MKTIRIGLSATFTGEYSHMGKQSFRGISLWADDTNSANGIYVRKLETSLPVELVFEDDGSDPGKTAAITSKLIKEKDVDIVLGPYSSSLARAACEVCTASDRTLWNYGGSSDEVMSCGHGNIISSITPASRYYVCVLELLIKYVGSNTEFAVAFAENSGFSTTVANGLTDYAGSLGVKTRSYKFVSGQESFRDLISAMEDNNEKVIFFAGRFEDDVRFAKQLLENEHSFNAVALIGASIEEFRSRLGTGVNGFISTSQWDPELVIDPDEGPAPDEFRQNFRLRFGSEPDYLSAQAYNMGIILRKCIETTGNLDDKKLRETAKKLSLRTFYGDFSVNPENGNQTGHSMVVVQWQDNIKRVVAPEEYATSKLMLEKK